MTLPMIVLAIGSIGAGAFLVTHERLARWLEPSLGAPVQPESPRLIPVGLVPIIATVLMLLGVGVAYLTVGRRPVPVQRPERVAWPVRAARADLYANALNEHLIARPGTWFARALVYLDNRGVDGVVNGTAALLGGSSGRARRTQTGFVRSYALTMLGGTVVVVAALLAVNSHECPPAGPRPVPPRRCRGLRHARPDPLGRVPDRRRATAAKPIGFAVSVVELVLVGVVWAVYVPSRRPGSGSSSPWRGSPSSAPGSPWASTASR